MKTDCIFCRIVQGEIPCRKVFEDEQVLAFHDLNPQAPVHILLIPKKHIPSLSSAVLEDQALLGHLQLVAKKIAASLGSPETSFRLVVNDGAQAGQSVLHLHYHLLAGRHFGWPPG